MNTPETVAPEWIRPHMDTALCLAEAALAAGEFPVGCVIACQDQIVSTGARTSSSGQHPNETDHAEIRALQEYFALDAPPPAETCIVISTLEPCLMCFGALLISGFRTIAYAYEDAMGGGTSANLSVLPPLYRNACPRIIPGIRRNRSLRLFQQFFRNPETIYWKNSLLSQYTLSQALPPEV